LHFSWWSQFAVGAGRHANHDYDYDYDYDDGCVAACSAGESYLGG